MTFKPGNPGRPKRDYAGGRMLERDNPDPEHLCVQFRKGAPMLVNKQIMAWRRFRRKQRAKARAYQDKINKLEQRASEIRARQEGLVFNPFSSDEE